MTHLNKPLYAAVVISLFGNCAESHNRFAEVHMNLAYNS